MCCLGYSSVQIHGAVQAADDCHRILHTVVLCNAYLSIDGWDIPKPETYWGIPLPCFCFYSAVMLLNYLCLDRESLLLYPSQGTVQLVSPTGRFTSTGSGSRSVHLPPSPFILTTDGRGSPHITRCRRFGTLCSPRSSSITSVSMPFKRSPQPIFPHASPLKDPLRSNSTTLLSPDLRRSSFFRHCGTSQSVDVSLLRRATSQPTILWGDLIFLIKSLMIIGGFTEIITEAEMIILSYSFCENSFILPVDSPRQSSLPLLESFSLKKRTVSPLVFPMENIFSPNIKWSCKSISITELLTCVAVRSGPEDVTEFVSTLF